MSGFFIPFIGGNSGGGGGTQVIGSPTYYGTTEFWNSQPDLISEVGALYIYLDAKDYNGKLVPRLKFGNGLKLSELPFIDWCSHTEVPIYVDEPVETVVDPGEQDIFYGDDNESVSFGNALTATTDEDDEKVIIKF